MKKYLIILLSILFLSPIVAQQRDASAVNLLNKVAESYKSPIQIKFSFNLKNSKENINQSQSGSVYSAGSRYNLSLDGITQLYDGKKVYTISKEDKEVTIVSNPDKEDLLTPTKVLNSYKSGYNVKNSGSKKVNGKTATIVTLTPTSSSSPTSKIELAIDGPNKDLIKVTEYNKQGTVTTISIKNVSKNVLIPNSFFTFNQSYYKKQGYYITTL